MKLKVRQTVLVGLAFLSISAFWQLYDTVIPVVLNRTFGLAETVSGVVMAADNVLALFLLPLFGSLSDKAHSKLGKRTPFIIGGTLGAIIFMNLIPVLDNAYASSPSVPILVLFIAVLGLLLISMGTYRSPAVALMPDVTPKPLRSKGNAVINLMGAVGVMIFLLLTAIIYPDSKTQGVDHVNYQIIFALISGLMVLSVIILVLTVRENKLSAEVTKYEEAHLNDEPEDKNSKNNKLSLPVRRSLIFMLLSVALWYMGYNAISSKFSIYVSEVMDGGIGSASTMILIGNVGAIAAFIPIGIISSKIGRKKMILFGTSVLSACLVVGYVLTVVFNPNEHTFIKYIMYVVFVLVGISWASINVNSFPMVVEMCKGSDTGKFTGYYYAFSMSAQVVTPILVGLLIDLASFEVLFPYAAVFVALSFCTMLFVKHGDTKIVAKKGIEAFEAMDAD